ncbi:MAG: hypothetical protein CM1200mP20_00020 [Pseudomonadota bacterium]|nr:MAG: hypothetical protein CM1200mP20_00020 [Pseudomonadota bacterium]
MTLEDMRDFRNEVAVAQTCRYRGWDVYTGDIYCQGPVLLQALAILSEFDLSQLEHNGADYLHLVIESLKLAFSDREKYYGDPQIYRSLAEQFLTPEHADGLRRLIRMDSVLPDLTTLQHSIDGPAVGRARRRDTTNFCIVDQDGNAFSCAPSDTNLRQPDRSGTRGLWCPPEEYSPARSQVIRPVSRPASGPG